MSEFQTFTEMLGRAGVGFGVRVDHNPPGKAVQVEHDDDSASHGFRVTEWSFDRSGRLTGVSVYEGEPG